MNSGATVDGSETLRLFCALRLPDEALDRLVEWQLRELGSAPVRVVPREHLHVTLAFLGRLHAGDVPPIVEALREAAAAAAESPLLQAIRYRETRSVGMVVLS